MFNRRQMLGMGFAGLATTWPSLVRSLERGEFSGNARVELLSGRKIKLITEFSYKDPSGKVWKVPEGYVSDGASIPRVLWSAVGGPLDGAYRDAALIHDFYCDVMEHSWEQTHRVFFDGMITKGLSIAEATKKFWAVFYFGPRWDSQYRWTGVMQLNKRPRSIGAHYSGAILGGILGGIAKMAGEMSDPTDGATAPNVEQQYQFELREFERVSKQIDENSLGPNDVPSLKPMMP